MAPRSFLVLLLGLALPVGAETAATTPAPDPDAPATSSDEAQPASTPQPDLTEAPKFNIREIDFGLEKANPDTNSSKFREYRALPNGVILPYVHFAGNDKFWFDVLGERVLQDDAHYHVDAQPWSIGLVADFLRIPHELGNDGRTLLTQQSGNSWLMSPSLQQYFQNQIAAQYAINPSSIAYPFLSGLVGPSLANANTVDLKIQRDRGYGEIQLTRNSPLDVRISYFQEHREGDRGSGTSFGFGNVVETPEPIDYQTRDYALKASWTKGWGLMRASFDYNDFDNKFSSETFSNPFRATDSTDPSAYTAPASGSIGGPGTGRVALPPDNKAITGTLGFVYKLGRSTRLTADAAVGEWTQNAPFIPFTTNTAIAVPDQGLPASLDGKIKTFSLSANLNSQPAQHLFLGARFKRYDLTNDTPQISLPVGYVRFDAAFEAVPRISVPYGNTHTQLQLFASYDFGPATLEGGYKLDGWDRTFRETDSTDENTGYLKLDVRARDWLTFHGSAEKGSRGYSGLDIARSEDASFLSPGPVTNLLATDPTLICAAGVVCNLRYDQAPKDVDRYAAIADFSPGSGKLTFTLAYRYDKNNYKDSTFGLLSDGNQSFTTEADFTPSDRTNVYAFYTWEKITNAQLGRQSGSSVSLNPLDNWTSNVDDRGDTFGGGANINLVKERVDLRLFGSYQRIDGNNALTAPAGGAPANARASTGGVQSIPAYDDTKQYSVGFELTYRATERWKVAGGYWYEYLKINDANTTGLVNYVPGSFFLAPNDSDYHANVVYVRGSYVW